MVEAEIGKGEFYQTGKIIGKYLCCMTIVGTNMYRCQYTDKISVHVQI